MCLHSGNFGLGTKGSLPAYLLVAHFGSHMASDKRAILPHAPPPPPDVDLAPDYLALRTSLALITTLMAQKDQNYE